MNTELFSILQTRITHPLHPEFSCHDQGVALIIVNSHGEVLLGKELHEDVLYDRKSGQWNIITETREEGELVKTTVTRGIQEELGTTMAQFQVVAGSYRETNILYTQTMGYPYKYRCIMLRHRENSFMQFQSSLPEIATHQWFNTEERNTLDIEMGARMVIQEYQKLFSRLFA